MIKSMTGYGRATEPFSGGSVTAEIKSVNNRYLDVSVHLPRTFTAAEEPVRRLIRENVGRGKVDIYLTLEESADTNVTVLINHRAAEAYAVQAKEISEELGISNDLTVASLFSLPNVLTAERETVDTDAFIEASLKATANALSAFNAMRAAEGANLVKDLLSKTDALLISITAAEKRSPETVVAYQQRLLEKLQKVLDDRQMDEGRILEEAAIWADKVCVDEETVRFRSHVGQMREILAGDGAVGRKLDFLLQETNREANTIGSKASDTEMAEIVVDIKTQLEKIREQVQNLE